MEEIAKVLGGQVKGDASYKVTRVAHPADALSSGDLVLAMDKNLMPLLTAGAAEAAIVAEGAEVPDQVKAYITVGRSRYAMSKLTKLFEKKIPVPPGIHAMAVVEEGAKVADNVSVGAFSYVCAGAVVDAGTVIHPQVYIGPDAHIGADSLIHSGVRIGPRVKIGMRAIIHYNTTIGGDGFSFVTPEMGSVESAKATGEIGDATNTTIERIASLGSVILGNDVEVGANSSIDKGTIVSTRVGNGTKIDNQVQIGHNVVIGDNCMLCGRAGMAGSSVIGDRVVLGGGVGVADHVKVGDDVVVMAMSGVAGNVAPKSIVGGLPAKSRERYIRDIRNVARIRPLSEKVKVLTERLDKIDNDG